MSRVVWLARLSHVSAQSKAEPNIVSHASPGVRDYEPKLWLVRNHYNFIL